MEDLPFLSGDDRLSGGGPPTFTLTIPVYQTAPTGRTWLWLPQAGGASNVSQGFAI